MDLSALKYVGVGLCTIGMYGAAIGVGNIFNGLLNSIARNPSATQDLQKFGYVGAGLAEAMGIFAFVLAMIMLF